VLVLSHGVISDMRNELLLLLLRHLHVNSGSRDRPIWDWDCKRAFSVMSVYFKVNDGGLRCPFIKVICGAKASLKVRTFLLSVINGAILGIISEKETGRDLVSV